MYGSIATILSDPFLQGILVRAVVVGMLVSLCASLLGVTLGVAVLLTAILHKPDKHEED